MKKINRNERIVATVNKIDYICDQSAGGILCKISINFRTKNKPLKHIVSQGIAINSDLEFDSKFGEKLARAKAEYNTYYELKKYAINCISNNINSNLDFIDMTYYLKVLPIYLNTIQFADAMIKHQENYIHKLIRNKYGEN